jgi:lysylphosphatidylglycerol synthetase-like protein (DUF2156 family)
VSHTHTHQPARITLPTRSLIGTTGRPARYVPAACTDIRATFAKWRRLQQMKARTQAGCVKETFLDYLTAVAVAAGLAALLLHSNDALAGTTELPASLMPVEFLAAFGAALVLLLLTVVVLLVALHSANKANRDNAERLRHAATLLRQGHQVQASAANERATERAWQQAAATRSQKGGAQ